MLVSNQPTKDIGRVKFGEPYSFIFEVSNNGNIPLEITKIVRGCNSCTKASPKKSKLLPGEISSIDVIFTPGSIGAQKKFITVKWNEVNDLKLSFTAESYA